MIESYSFGRIVINGKVYHSDIILYPDNVRDNWQREKGHILSVDDIKGSIERFRPEILVIGTGKDGLMKIPDETMEYLHSRGIKIISGKTEEACKKYNTILQNKKVMGAFHLTC